MSEGKAVVLKLTSIHRIPTRYTMSESKGSIQLRLTPEQQEQVRKATGKLTDTLEMSIEELEERIQPFAKWR